jgi:hypothetical protein
LSSQNIPNFNSFLYASLDLTKVSYIWLPWPLFANSICIPLASAILPLIPFSSAPSFQAHPIVIFLSFQLQLHLKVFGQV